MGRYEVIITLSNGNKVNAKVMAKDQAHALERLEEIPQFVEFIEGNEIEKVDIKPIPFEGIEEGRFLLQRSEKPDKWVCTDTVNKFVVIFDEGKFNETQQITPLEDFNPDDYMKIAQWMREIGEWLSNNYSEIV